MTRSKCVLLLLSLAAAVAVNAKTATKSSSSSASSSSSETAASATSSLPRRQGHLDFMDAETLAYYLGVDATTGERLMNHNPPAPSDWTHNVAVMFYAQRDRNSHALAPYWDAIGTQLKAGTKKANIILGLFDCELDQQHFDLCNVVGVTHYPTLLFISPTRTFPHKPAALTKHHKPLPHTTFYPGMWQYDKSILDWLRTMQFMSGWSAFWNRNKPQGWWKAAAAAAKQNRGMANALPVGVPASAGTASTSSVVSPREVKQLQEEKKQYEELLGRTSILLDAALFPIANPLDATSTDVYAYLNATDGWKQDTSSKSTNNKNAALSLVIRSCAMEIALDYCARLTDHKTTELVERLNNKNGNTQQQQQPSLEELQAELSTMISAAEPYCDGIEMCILEGFVTEACKPATCPFRQDVACRYLSSCFDQSMQADYATALGVTLTPSGGQETGQAAKSRGWF